MTSLFVALLALSACGGNSSLAVPISTGGGGGGNSAVPHFSHVAIVVLENAGYNEVIGNTSMPYLNSLATHGSVLASYYANAHPSIPNYFMLTTGQPVTLDDSFTGTVSVDNLAREFLTSSVTWKAYEESIPSAGYTGGDTALYLERHDPFSYFSDVRNSSTEAANLVPFAQLATDISARTLPNFLWITPNVLDDAHNCPAASPNCSLNSRLATADGWLSTNIAPLLSNPNFASSGLLIIVFDEGDTTDVSHGGGHTVGILAGTHVKTGYTSTATYQDQDVLSLIGHALQLGTIPGAGATGASMTEFFQ